MPCMLICERTVEVNSHGVVEGRSMEGLLRVLEGLRNYRIIKGELDLAQSERTRLIDERLVTKDGARVGGHSGPAVRSNFLVAHFEVEKEK